MLWSHRSANPVVHATRCVSDVPCHATRLRRGREACQWLVSAGALMLTSCGGPQSALDPAGRGAERIADLFWWMVAGAGIIWLAVVGLAIHAMRVRPESYSQRQATLLIIGGGAVVPTVVLGGLLAYGLALLPALLAPAPEGSLKIAVSGEQWWWRVRYLTSGGNDRAVELANEIRLPVGARVEFHLESPDVIHSFWIPALGGKIDMLPGRLNRLTLEPTRHWRLPRRLRRVLRDLARPHELLRGRPGAGRLRRLAGAPAPAGTAAYAAARGARPGAVPRQRLWCVPHGARHCRRLAWWVRT